MRFNVVAIDETRDWLERIVATTGRIWTVYMYNPRQVTYACEITPSYYLMPVDWFCENPLEDDDALYDEIGEAFRQSTEPIYMHCKDIEAIPRSKGGIRLKASKTGFEDEEAAREFFQGNAVLG